jgi:hypothetical protein
VDPVTGQTFVSQYDIFTVGAGYLDAAAALANTDLATGTAMSPIASYNSGSGQVTLTFDPSSSWNDTDIYARTANGGTPGVWGLTTVWGNSVINADKTMWGTSTVWGESSPTGFSTVWGASGIWASKTMWGTSTTSADKTMWGTDSSSTDSNTDFTTSPR